MRAKQNIFGVLALVLGCRAHNANQPSAASAGGRPIGTGDRNTGTGDTRKPEYKFGDCFGEVYVPLTLGVSEAAVTGSLDLETVYGVLSRHRAEIQCCFDSELPSKPELHGDLVVHFIIEGDGRVSLATVKSSTLSDATAEDCVLDRFKSFRFPNPTGPGVVTVDYPLAFRPKP